jgi:(1->4)-alpha-D-glucan 1-alpha-D-glucosylmutase
MTAFRVPVATYRIQFNQSFRFADARELVPYLHELGISDVYASPRFKARRGSSHGYDVANPLRINSELGTEEDFDELCEKLKHYGMGLLLDIVPNHMAASSDNPWWMDVLENGPGSAYADYFDIDWHPAPLKAAFLQENRVLLPVLGDLYGTALENEELTLKLDESGFFVRYYDIKLPLDPKSYHPILSHCARVLRESHKAHRASYREMLQIIRAVEELPVRTVTGAKKIEQRRTAKEEIKRLTWRLYLKKSEVTRGVDETLRLFNGVKGEPASFDLLDRLLADQAYRVAFWKIGHEEINYRRFFDINELVGLRVDEPEVFEARHAQIIQLVHEGKITSLRVDHIDGRRDPLAYLTRLQAACGSQDAVQTEHPNVYVAVEKILGRAERLPEDWPVCGTTGYDFLNALNGIFVEPEGLKALESLYGRWTGSDTTFAEICYSRNRQVMRELFAGEVHALGHHLGKLAAQDRNARDLPLSELMQILVEVTACLPVYRTYIRDFEISQRDHGYIERTLDLARRRTPEDQVSSSAFAFMRRVLLLDPPYYAEDQKEEWLRFVMRWQQFAGPVMAKGLEDTAFYAHNSLISLNEVGGDPLREHPPFDVQSFHCFNQTRLERWPYSMNATSTHDTKRGEDARARINVLSELPEEWERSLQRWRRLNHGKKQHVNGRLAPTPNEEMLIYQTLIGAWPLEPDESLAFLERLRGFLIKATREAKTHSSWISINEAHENALLRFVEDVLVESGSSPFREDFLRFQKKVAYYGALNGLSQLLLKIAAPGVPDLYQGTELWNLSLVDPDNRRPVYFGTRIRFLEELKRQEAENLPRLLQELLAHWADGRIKLYLMYKALEFRRSHRELFLDGAYIPLPAAGPKEKHVCAFVRHKGESWALAVVPRLTAGLVKPGRPPLGKRIWADTALLLPESAPRQWRNGLTRETLDASLLNTGEVALYLHKVLKRFPVALLYGV